MIAAAVVITMILILAAAVRLYAVYAPDIDDPHDYCADDTRNPEDDK
jgi:hypothetical protein